MRKLNKLQGAGAVVSILAPAVSPYIHRRSLLYDFLFSPLFLLMTLHFHQQTHRLCVISPLSLPPHVPRFPTISFSTYHDHSSRSHFPGIATRSLIFLSF